MQHRMRYDVADDNYWLNSYYTNCKTVEGLEDNSLVEECMFMEAEIPELDDIYANYMATGSLPKAHRRILEYFYVTYYTTTINAREH